MNKKLLITSTISILALVGTFTTGVFAASDIKLFINGKPINADIQIVNGSSYVPLRVIAESFGAEVKWDEDTRSIRIKQSGVTPKDTKSSETYEDTESLGSTKELAVGDSIKLNNLVVTLNGVRTSAGLGYEKPDNEKLLFVDLTIENTGTESAAVSTLLNMSLYDDNSYKHGITLSTAIKGSLDGKIAAGRKVRGEVAFDVPNSTYYEFVYSEILSGTQGIWKFSLKK